MQLPCNKLATIHEAAIGQPQSKILARDAVGG